MIGDVFYYVLNMSITGTMIGVLIVLIRRIKHIPRKAPYLLWLVVGIRLVLPFALNSPMSMLSVFGSFFKTVPTPSFPDASFSNAMQAVDYYYPLRFKTALLQTIFTVSGYIWLVILILLLLFMFILYAKNRSLHKNIVLVKGNIYADKQITTPIAYGLWKQKIIIPADLDTETLKYAIKHEEIHCSRHDNLRRMLGIAVCCIHWFNPFVWIYLKLFFDDLENSCDEAAIRNMNQNEIKAYSSALLKVASGGHTAFNASFGGSNVASRINNVLQYKKLSIFASVFILILTSVLFYVLLTNSAG